MSKKETIWRYILIKALSEKVRSFTQKEIANIFKISTSTVFNALKAPRALSAIEVTGRFFRLRDAEKLLLLWATQRSLRKDILYTTHVDEPVRSIEGGMIPGAIFGAFSAYRLKYDNPPADYDVVYVYSDNLQEMQKRFPKIKGHPNLFVLKPDPYLASFGATTPDVQTFVDLWNIPEWYAKDFQNAIKLKLFPNA